MESETMKTEIKKHTPEGLENKLEQQQQQQKTQRDGKG